MSALAMAPTPTRRAEVVFGRGGIRGIALAGAAAGFAEAGYRIERVAGISAGSMVAALVAAGYGPADIRRVVWDLDFAALRDGPARLPGVGPMLALFGRLGLYGGDALLAAFRELLADRGVRTFGDLRVDRGPARAATDARARSAPPLRVLAADLTRGRVIVLPDQAPEYGIDPDRLEVALALRMSASVPFFFRPIRFGSGPRPSLIVDGGLLLGIPFALLEAGRRPDCPVFGVQALPGDGAAPIGGDIRSPLSLLTASYRTALAANERCNRSTRDAARTIDIECGPIRAVDFEIRHEERRRLYEAGREATLAFLSRREATPAVVARREHAEHARASARCGGSPDVARGTATAAEQRSAVSEQWKILHPAELDHDP